MKTVSVVDTTISSYNLGNEIIMDAVNSTIEELFPDSFLFRIPWEEKFSRKSLKYMAESDYCFFGGTNSFSSYLLRYKQHGFRLRELLSFRSLISFGMGWWQYQAKPDLYSAFFWKQLLSDERLHSVRDEYTKKMLESIGVSNVLNTSCPTTWSLSGDHCAGIPAEPSEHVVTTLTDYNPSFRDDAEMLDMLSRKYKSVTLWLQGYGDQKTFKHLFDSFPSLKFIPPKLSSYDKFLAETQCDYVGTRLHAGIRALQKKRRSLIVAVDNRAQEISRDIDLNVCKRGDVDSIAVFISSSVDMAVSLPSASICDWKAQFCS